jgi:4-oxalocrotonate tautomerase
MPHIIIKLWPGKSEQQKKQLTEAITKDVMSVLNYGEESVSVAIEEVNSQDWAEKVYKPDIVHNPKNLYLQEAGIRALARRRDVVGRRRKLHPGAPEHPYRAFRSFDRRNAGRTGK